MKILIVEDEPVIAIDIKRTLLKSGYEVASVVRSGEQAVEQVTQDPPDLVLMDIKLPGKIDGIEAAAQIRAIDQVPVVYLTAHSNESLIERSKRTEPYGYLLKPFREKELQATIELARYKYEMELKEAETRRQLEQEISPHLKLDWRYGDDEIVSDFEGRLNFVSRNQAQHCPSNPTGDILVVDDNPDSLCLLLQILRKKGYTVRSASNGLRALDMARQRQPDLILLDIRMPGMDGYTVCKRLKADSRTREIPVLFLSVLDEIRDITTGLKLGAIDYITKPFHLEEVLARVETHLAVQNLQKGLRREIVQWRKTEEGERILNQKLQEMIQQLQEVNASKDKFFSIIAHDLRTPFNGVMLMTEMLMERLEQYDSITLTRGLHTLHTVSEKVSTLLKNLLEWSQLERGLIEPALKIISLMPIVTYNLNLFAANAAQKQITLENRLQTEMNAYADINMINTVLRNLLSNAIKFTQAGGTVVIDGAQQTHSVKIVISDTGIGMEQSRLNNLFRIDARCTRRGTGGEEGTGLGLILCKELLEKNGGTIHVHSEIGKGTMCTMTLPKTESGVMKH